MGRIAGMTADVAPFRLAVPEADLELLRERLRATRWPEREPVEDWSHGVPLAYVRELCDHWAERYDWRATEARLNALSQWRTEIDGLPIHFLHVRSRHREALPLILTHGWPGSVVEFLDVIEPLVDPTAHGGEAGDAFHLVVPSLPGYGFSGKPRRTGWGVERTARAWAALMARLGYERYGAQGSDWGTSVTASLGQQDAAHLAGIHLTPPLAAPDPSTFDDLTAFERAALDDLADESGGAYAKLHATRPQTIGYALVDSPAALAAWVVEKLWSWSDHDGDLEQAIPRDRVLDNLMLHWLPATGASAARLYWESFADVERWIGERVEDTVDVPAGCSIFPRENPRTSRRWAERRFTDIRHWNELDRGGHFAALEQPDLFVGELRSFFGLVR